jgi:hypothetical protein
VIYGTSAGATSAVIRDSTNNIEAMVYAGSSIVVMGSATAHNLELRTNDTTAVYVDGSTQTVGVGIAAETPRLVLKAGGSTNSAAVGGVLFVSTTETGNVGTGEDDLVSYTVPASTLGTNGQSIWFEAHGKVSNSANTKQIRVRWDATLLGTSGTIDASIASDWVLRGRIIRTGAATQKGYMWLGLDGNNFGNSSIANANNGLTATLSGAIVLKITGTGTSNNDIQIESFTVGFDDNNT